MERATTSRAVPLQNRSFARRTRCVQLRLRVEEQWKIVDGIVRGGLRDRPAFPNYAAGSWRPTAAADLSAATAAPGASSYLTIGRPNGKLRPPVAIDAVARNRYRPSPAKASAT